MRTTDDTHVVAVFPSELGWIGFVLSGGSLTELTFGHRSAQAATRALTPELANFAHEAPASEPLITRLQEYAEGAVDDFCDVPVELGPLSAFQRKVIACCRKIPYGATMTYGALAVRAGAPGAARAVGNCMASNRVPLVIPCHRVVASGGQLGGYSAPAGVHMKRRLLDIESRASCSRT